jgi:hypothetical protein
VLPLPFVDFEVHHDYLLSSDGTQVRVRCRGQNGVCLFSSVPTTNVLTCSAESQTYTCTVRRNVNGQKIDQRRSLRRREYQAMLAQRDPERATVKKRRRCFYQGNHYFQVCTDRLLRVVLTDPAD